jgi:alpha-mannosidase
MIYPYSGDLSHAQIFKNIANYHTPLSLIQGGAGKGELPLRYSLLESMNPEVVISAIKKSEEGESIIIRLFNPCVTEKELKIRFNDRYSKITDCGMAEDRDELLEENSNNLNYRMKPKKIVTLRLIN